MHPKYHRQITAEALQNTFGTAALKVIIRANLHQDDLIRNLWIPEHHFVNNRFEASSLYIQKQRKIVIASLEQGGPVQQAWQAFGRLLHTVQDFYSHSNYIRLWARRLNGQLPSPDQVEAMDPAFLNSPELHTVRTYRPLGTLANLPIVGRWLFPLLPEDAHARMCLDSNASGPLFEYACSAAVKRTIYEYHETERLAGKNGAGEYWSSFLQAG